MSRYEIFSPEGLRLDGRRYNDLRSFSAKLHTHPQSANGSCTLQQGNTRVLCLVRGPTETAKQNLDPTLPSINVTISSHDSGSNRPLKRLRKDRRLIEMGNHIKHTLEQIVLKNIYNRTGLDIQITVLANYGGLLAACLNATILALVDSGVAIYDYVAACSVGVWDNVSLVDTSDAEEMDVSCVSIGVVGNSDDFENARIGLLVAEDKMPLERLQNAMEIGVAGCARIRELMDQIVRDKGVELISKQQ